MPARIAPEANCNSRKSRWVTQTGRSIPDSPAEARTNVAVVEPLAQRSRNGGGQFLGLKKSAFRRHCAVAKEHGRPDRSGRIRISPIGSRLTG